MVQRARTSRSTPDVLPRAGGRSTCMTAFVRVEGRYDAIYSEGFRLFPSVNTYGNHARRLPKRLRDAKDLDYAAMTPGPEGTARGSRTRSPRRTRRSASAAASPTTTSSSASPAATTSTAPRTTRRAMRTSGSSTTAMRSSRRRGPDSAGPDARARPVAAQEHHHRLGARHRPRQPAARPDPRHGDPVGLRRHARAACTTIRPRCASSRATRSSPASPRRSSRASRSTRSPRSARSRPRCSRPTP